MVDEGGPVEDDRTDRVFVAFEGGGAKGLVHIGALKALEEYGAAICGLAGTSAGAIIAALRATGMHADDMVDPVRGTTLLPLLGRRFRSATDIFGRGGWLRIAALRFAIKALSGRRRIITVALALLALFGSLVAAYDYGEWAVAVAVAVWIVVTIIGADWLLSGLSSVHIFRDALQKLLQENLFPDEPGRHVLFSDFGVDERPTLKIVATDLNARQLRLFSPEQTPDICVADAVAASICLPVIFRPFELGASVFLDGGLVSNLPAWPFDEERALDPDALTIAVEIIDTEPDNTPVSRSGWLGAAVKTAIFGSSILNKRAVGRLEVVPIETQLKVLDFDIGAHAALQAVAEATNYARARIVQRLLEGPGVLREATQDVFDLARTVLAEQANVFSSGTLTGRIRVALAIKEVGLYRSLRLRHGIGYKEHSDEAMLLPIEGSLAGRTWLGREPTFTAIFHSAGLIYDAEGTEILPGPANRQRRRLIWPELAWSLCVPVFPAGYEEPAFVVVLEGEEEIADGSPNLEGVVNLLSEGINTIFEEPLKRLARLGYSWA
jgi:NTE family protein